MSSRHFTDDVIGEHTMPFEDADRHIVDPISRRSNHSSDSSRGGGCNRQSPPFMTGNANFTNGLLAANDQRLLALVDAANVAAIGARLTPPPPPIAATSSTRRPSLSPAATPPPASLVVAVAASPAPHHHNVPTDYERCHLGLQQLQASLAVARRVDDLARTLKYVNDDITSLAISSFSSNDLWRSLGYRGTPDDAKFQLRKRRLDIKAAMMRAAAMGESVNARPPSSSGAGGAAVIRKISTAFLKDTPRSSSMRVAGDGGSVSDAPLPAGQPQQPRPSSSSSSSSNNNPPPLDLRLTSAARFAEVCKFGGVLADESTEILVTFQEFVTQLAEGKFTSPDVFRTLLEFPPESGSASPSSGNISASRRGSNDSLRTPVTSEGPTKGPSDIGTSPLSLKRQQQRRNSAGGGPPTPPPKGGAPSASPPTPEGAVVIEEAMKIKAARQKELDIKCKFAHDLEIRSLCIEEERRFQRIFVLEVLSLIAVQQLEQEIDLAKQRLRTCEVLKHRSDANPERAASDTDMQQCIELIPTLKETIGHSVQQLQVFEQKLHRRFNRALTDSVKELCGFNREVHCWNHYVDRRARRHANAKRRTLQSLFTALSKLETGELSLDKNPEVFIKVQLFEKMDSTITLARQAQDMLARYKQRLAALDKLPNGKITSADLERWTVELKQRGGAGGSRRKSAALGTAKKKKSGVSPPQSTLGSVKSLGSKVAKSVSGGGGQSGGASSRSRRSSIASSNHSGGDGGGGDSGDDKKKSSKRWRFKLYDETHDEERFHQYEALLDAESDVVLSSVEAILSMLSDNVNLWASPNISKTSSSSNLPRVSSGQRQRSNSSAVKLPSRPTSSAPPIPPPRPVKFFYVALLSVVSDVLDAFHVEISRWDDADLVIDTDDDNEDTEAAEPSVAAEGGGGGKKVIGGGSQDPLNRSMSSSFGGSSAASSMGSAPSAHVPSWIDEEEQRKNAYRTTVLRLTNLKQSLQQLVEQVFGSSPPLANGGSRSGGGGGGGSVVGFLKKYDPTKHQRHNNNGRRASHDPTSNSDDTLFRVFEPPTAENHSVTPPLVAAMRGSPSTPHDGGGASTSAALIPLSLVNTQPDPVPLPACLVELEERERDLIILRPGELLLPPSDPPLWMSGGGGADEVVVDDDGGLQQTILPASSSPKSSSSHRGPSFLERLIKMMRKDEQSNDLHRGALSLETHQPFWRRKGSAANAGAAVNRDDSGAPPSSPRRGTKVPTSQANALRSLGDHVMHHQHQQHHGNSARPPTAPKPSSSQQQQVGPNSSRRPHHTNVQQHHMVGGARDWARRWSADTTGGGGGSSRSQQQLNGSTPVSPTGMPEAYSWTPGGSPGTAALRAPKPHQHHPHPNSDPLRHHGELPTLGEDELDGGFAPWGGTGTSAGGLGSYEGADSWRTSRPGTGSNHASALKEAKLRLAPRPRGSGGGGSDVADRRWSPTKPFR